MNAVSEVSEETARGYYWSEGWRSEVIQLARVKIQSVLSSSTLLPTNIIGSGVHARPHKHHLAGTGAPRRVGLFDRSQHAAIGFARLWCAVSAKGACFNVCENGRAELVSLDWSF